MHDLHLAVISSGALLLWMLYRLFSTTLNFSAIINRQLENKPLCQNLLIAGYFCDDVLEYCMGLVLGTPCSSAITMQS